MLVCVGFSESLALANKLYIPSERAMQMYCDPIRMNQNCRLEQSGIRLKQTCAGDFHLFSFNKILLIFCPFPSYFQALNKVTCALCQDAHVLFQQDFSLWITKWQMKMFKRHIYLFLVFDLTSTDSPNGLIPVQTLTLLTKIYF